MYQPFQVERFSRWTKGIESSEDCTADIRDSQHITYYAIRYIRQLYAVDCPKITADKSSESRVQTPNARLIIATNTAVQRLKGRNPCLCFTAMAMTQSLKAAPQISMQCQDAKPEAYVSQEAWCRTWISRFSSVTSTKKREAWNPRLGYNCPHYWVSYEGVNPHYGEFLGDNFTP